MLTTKQPPDCIESVPGYPTLLTIGTYLLEKEINRKTGSILFINSILPSIITEIETRAVFDAHWIPNVRKDTDTRIKTLCVATSANSIEVHDFHFSPSLSNTLPIINERHCFKHTFDSDASQDISALSFCYLPNLSDNVENVEKIEKNIIDIAVGCSDGKVHLSSIFDGNDEKMNSSISHNESWLAHTYSGTSSGAEVWAVATPPLINTLQHSTIWTGADDTLLKIWDRRSLIRPQQICREHGAGVCNIAFHPLREHIVATGSYDEHLRV